MKQITSWLLIVLCFGVTNVNAGGVGRAVARGAARGIARSAERSVARGAARATVRQEARRAIAIQRKDLWNHLHTPVRPLPAPRTVHRYTSPSIARQELRSGVAPGRHMTAAAPAGKPPSPATAMSKYGLQKAPNVRETIELPKGFPVRHNKVPGGRPGAGEITSQKRVPPEAIKKLTPLR
jgi:hypothetical protein